MKIKKKCELKWNHFTHSITTLKTDSNVIKMMECQQAIRLWKLNPVYEVIFSIA